MADPQRVYIIDDDRGQRDSLRFLLEAYGFRIETFDCAPAFLKVAPQAEGCVIVDVQMPGMTGLELQARLAAEAPRLALVLITGHADVAMAVQAMKAGAVDFIEKPIAETALLASVRRALARIMEARREDAAQTDLRLRLDSLTPREHEVLEHLVTGSPHKVIGQALDISPRTIEVHRARIMQKLGARNLADLVRLSLAAHEQADMHDSTSS